MAQNGAAGKLYLFALKDRRLALRLAGDARSLLYIYFDEPPAEARQGWVLVKRSRGLQGLIEAVRFGLSFAPELVGYEASIVEAEAAEELALLAGLSPSLGRLYVLYKGDVEAAAKEAGLSYNVETLEGSSLYKLVINIYQKL
nr:MAG: hypothetical protein TU35_00250 [Thermoproteus sp. AZ2]